FGAIAGGIASALAGGAMSKLFGGGQKAASGGIQGDVLATDNNTVGMGVGALRLSPLRRGLAIDSTVDIFTFYVPHRHVYGEQWIKFMKDGVNATPLPTVNTTGYIDHAAFLGTINP